MKKPEEYRSEFALAMHAGVNASDEAEGFDIDVFMAKLLDHTISRVQRDAVEACIEECERTASEYSHDATQAEERRQSRDVVVKFESRGRGATACANRLSALLKEPQS